MESCFVNRSSFSTDKLDVILALFSALLLVMVYIGDYLGVKIFQNIFLCFIFFFVGVPAVIGAFRHILKANFNIEVLMTLAAFGSIVIGSPHEGALLLILFSLSEALERSVANKLAFSLDELKNNSPKKANVIHQNGHIVEVSVKDVKLYEHILIKSGEMVPLDGVVVKGQSTISVAHLTGEAMPFPIEKGSQVIGGSKNCDVAFELKVTKTSDESMIAKILQLITDAKKNKPVLQRFLDRFSKPYASTVMILTVIATLVLAYGFSIDYITSIKRALAFMIAMSPCALIIATPTAYLSAITSCSKQGVLIKGGIILDTLAKCKKIVFDKTGTLTYGELLFLKYEPLNKSDFSFDDIIGIAYGLEKHAVHPIAKALVDFAQKKKILPYEILDSTIQHGHGLKGQVICRGKKIAVAIGLYDFIAKDFHIEPKNYDNVVCYLLIDSALFVMHFSDNIRQEAGSVIKELRALKIAPVMLTGDNSKSVETVAKTLAIDVICNVRPEDKLKYIAKISSSAICAMVGDGINDAPALAKANIGISMGLQSDTASLVSDIVLLRRDLTVLPWLIHKSRQMAKIVSQNLVIALLVIPIASTLAILGWIPLWLAVVLHEGSTLVVSCNSLRLLKR